MKLRNQKIIACTQCETLYTIRAFRKLETTSDNRKLSACKSCDFAKGFVFDADREMLFSFGNVEGLDKLLAKVIEIDNNGTFDTYNIIGLLEKFGNNEHVVKAFQFALDVATLTTEEFQQAIDYGKNGKSLDALYNELIEKHSL